MIRQFKGHIGDNAVAYLALFVALGGTSYAAIVLPADSVGVRQIKKDAVRSTEVKNATLLAVDFKAGQLPTGPPRATPVQRVRVVSREPREPRSARWLWPAGNPRYTR